MSDKNEQDSHLAGLIGIQTITRRRPRKPDGEERKDHSASFNYKIRINGKEIQVCLKAFLSLHGVTQRRIRRIQHSLVYRGKSPRDMRGLHSNRPNKYPNEITELVRNHIQSFKARSSHYSLRHNPRRKYLPESLSVAKMHQLFLDLYQINVPYKIYWNIFSEYNIGFGYPRSDTCSICDQFNQKLNDPDSDKAQLAIDKELHLRKAEAFRQKKRLYKEQARSGEILCISFDFMQNLPLPHLKTNEVFYSRQLWYNVFGVHNLGTNVVTMFTYHEGEAKKGANDVTSMLFQYLKGVAGEHRNLVLISDSCCGQNKNYVMVHFLYILVHCLNMFDSVTHLFPVRGHSYLPNDQDFSLVEKKKRKLEAAEAPEDWDAIILGARKVPSPFNLHKVKRNEFLDMKKATDDLFLKMPKPPLKIKSVRMLNINKRSHYVYTRENYNGPWAQSVVVSPKKCLPREIELPFLYHGPLPIAPAKLQNIMSLTKFLNNVSNVRFYEGLGQQTNEDDDAGAVDISEDDNSSGCED